MADLVSRFDALIAAKRAALAAQREEFARAQPKKPAEVIAETVIEGRTVAEWSVDVDALDEAANDQARESRSVVVVDVTDTLPAAAVAAVHRWRAAGSPTEFSNAKEAIEAVRAEAEKHQALAVVEDGKAERAESLSDEKTAAQHRRYAATQRNKAAKFFTQAEKMLAEWKREHP
jgi:hypothetical protein